MMQDEPPAVLTLSIDAMGGDRGPATVVAALSRVAEAHPELRFLLHGPVEQLKPLLARQRLLSDRVTVSHADRVVAMADKPSAALRAARGTSMWSTLQAVAEGRAQAAVSCGNTGALMAMAMVALRKAEGVSRPAIAVFWPSRNDKDYNIVLDVGADLRAEPRTLAQYAVMGSEYARIGLNIAMPRVGLLNVGSEESKGRPELHVARDEIAAAALRGGYEWVGFVEGGDLSGRRADVIVTDGFTGNIALKTAEGTAGFVGEQLRRAFLYSPMSWLVSFLAMGALARLKRRIDPRRVNGGVFLGLDGAVVKSHGGADATGIAAAIELAARMARTGFAERVALRVAAIDQPSGHAPGLESGTAGAAPETDQR
jgi:glycerol-3-phosphate acyltransferase PlsX